MTEFREIAESDNEVLAGIIRENLKEKHLDIPGTVYFDTNLDHLSDYYLSTEGSYYTVLTEDGKVIGGVGLSEFTGFNSCAELQKLYLTNSVKGRGFGKELLNSIENKAREMGYSSMYLETHSNLDIAINLYEKMGYELIDRPDCVVHSTMNRFFYKKL